jgi:hypothetical protein
MELLADAELDDTADAMDELEAGAALEEAGELVEAIVLMLEPAPEVIELLDDTAASDSDIGAELPNEIEETEELEAGIELDVTTVDDDCRGLDDSAELEIA